MQLIEIPHAQAAGEPVMRDVELGMGKNSSCRSPRRRISHPVSWKITLNPNAV